MRACTSIYHVLHVITTCTKFWFTVSEKLLCNNFVKFSKTIQLQGALREKNLIKIYCENTKLNINLSFFTIKFHKILPGYQKGYTDQKKEKEKRTDRLLVNDGPND